MPEGLSLLVAEDNPRDREFLLAALGAHELRCFDNGREALDSALTREHPLLISDLQMPGLNGIELARTLWAERPGARIVFWSQFDDEMYIRALARIIPPETVYGYVLKSNPSEVLQKAVEAVFVDSQCWLDPKVRPVEARSRKSGSAVTDVEFEVLLDIALGLTDNMIGRRRFLSRRGVQSRLKSLYTKLGVDQEQFALADTGEAFNMRARAVSLALRRGLINAHEIEHEEGLLQDWIAGQDIE